MNWTDFVQILLGYFVTNVLGHILSALAILILGGWAVRVISRVLMAGARRSRVKLALVELLGASVNVAGWILIAAGVLQALNLNELAIAVGGSISLVALGVASAASGNLGDIIAGVFLASDPDFGTGFTIHTGEIIGTIEHIDLRKTRVRTEEGKLYIIPNKSIENNVWIVERRPADPVIPHRSGLPNLANLANLPQNFPQVFRRGEQPGAPKVPPPPPTTSTPPPPSVPTPPPPPTSTPK